ncbi:MAG: DUF5665 domain-containing protein [Candidatus Nomurabacteria bacterium]|jgi:hypothetical protein|nr:DUF5665 domain-containing protein [Candidatus Nomurabacteria bacterium]
MNKQKPETKPNPAEQEVVRDLLENYYTNRRRVYKQNFIRGVFFGMGTFVGGTIVVALVIWLLSVFTDIPGGVGDFVKAVIDTINRK